MLNNSLEDMLNSMNSVNKHPTRDEFLTDEVNNQILTIKDTSDISDGSHTFGELYHHRAVLFSAICNMNSEVSWKSKLHYNGEMIKNFFIVGIETPEGQYTYHYPLSYWKMFKVEAMDLAPEWDGHSSEDIDRLLSIINK